MNNIPLFKVYMPTGVMPKLNDVIHSGYVAEGDSVREFEKLLGEFGKNPNVVATNSCTSALHLALAMETQKSPGYVITTPMTCVATNVSIINLRNTVIWCDVDPINGMITRETLLETWGNMSPDQRANTKAIIFVVWGGDVGDLKRVYETADQLGIPLIVDAAQGFGAQIDGKPLPSVCGDYVTYSFQAIKHITTGDGGCLFLRNPNKLRKASIMKWFGIDRDMFRTPTGEINWKADIPEIGYKFHMNNIAACIGVAQMEDNLGNRLNRYKENAKFYQVAFEGRNDFRRSDNIDTSANWVYTAITTCNVDNLIKDLLEIGINSSRMHIRNDIYSGFTAADAELPGVVSFEKNHICIPCGWWLESPDRERVVEGVIKCLGAQS